MTANLSEWFRSTFGGIITMFIDGPNAGKQNIFREDPRFKEILSILSDYSSMRAESERLREDFEYKNEQLGSALIRVEKAEAELAAADKELAVRTESQGVAMAEVERLREDCDRTADVVVEQMAQLAKQAPLVEAVDKWDGRVAWASVKPLIQSIDDYRAALAPREEKK